MAWISGASWQRAREEVSTWRLLMNPVFSIVASYFRGGQPLSPRSAMVIGAGMLAVALYSLFAYTRINLRKDRSDWAFTRKWVLLLRSTLFFLLTLLFASSAFQWRWMKDYIGEFFFLLAIIGIPLRLIDRDE